MPQQKKKIALSWLRRLLLLTIPAMWCVLSYLGHLVFLENKLIDIRFRARGELEAPVKLIYVDIDNAAIQFYKWPWSHARFAQVLNALFDHGKVKAVGFDLVFSENSRAEFGMKEQNEGRVLFGKSIYKRRNVVLAVNYVPGPGLLQAKKEFPWIFDGFTDRQKNDNPEMPGVPVLGPTWGIPGLIDTYKAEARAAPIFADAPGDTFYPLSLRLALIDWGLTPKALHRFPDRMEVRRDDGALVTSIPLREQQIVEATWFSRWISPLNPRCSVNDVRIFTALIEGDDAEQKAKGAEFFAQFQDAIVLIGPVDPLLQDLAKTPFDDVPVPQVGFHGNLLKTFASGIYLRRLPESANIALTFFLTVFVVFLALTEGAKGFRFKLLALLVVTVYVAAAFGLFATYHLVLPMTAPLGSTIMTSLIAVGWELIAEQKAKGRIKGMFGTYVSPQLVERMVESGESPQLGGHDAEITAYFSDIQSFSTFSEKLGSGPLVELMNEYLTACTDIVQEQGGTLDKYIGDAVVAMFGAPIAVKDHAFRACVATQLVHQQLRALRKKWESEGEKWPRIVWEMQSRIGLNTGVCMIGNMGSRTRFNYTMMGDNVNLAARMESGAKSWGAYTMCTEVTKQACEQFGADRVIFRALGRIVVKGRTKPVPIYEIVGLKEAMPEGARECIAAFEQGLARYFARDWDAAVELFRQSQLNEPNQPGKTPGVKTNPSLVYLEIIERYKEDPPPPEWDGVYVMTEK
ncbi:MAG: hypothetical protein JWM88_1982 [Verrucomicrobia bacterium]|nr:hypothetical protein [Verrucomicrobiota bacterium]